MDEKNQKSEVLSQKIAFSDENFKIVVKNQMPAQQERALHEEIEIKYFYEGDSAFMINSDLFLAKPGDIAIVNPYEVHTTVSIDKYTARYYLIVIGLDILKELNSGVLDLRQEFLAKGKKVNNLIRDDKRLQAIILRIVEEMNDKKLHYQLIVQNLISEFFALLLRNYVNEEHSRKTSDEKVKYVELIAPALAHIHSNYMKRITIDELATLCSITKYHFCRVFSKAMGVTAVQYTTEYRVDLAEIMLKGTNKSINEIAYSCGFEDESYFYRCYKKVKGVPPKTARKQ